LPVDDIKNCAYYFLHGASDFYPLSDCVAIQLGQQPAMAVEVSHKKRQDVIRGCK